MKSLITFLSLFFLLTLSACSMMGTSASTSDITFKTDVDPKANFKGYKTYAWIGSASILNDPDNQWKAPGFDSNAEIKFLIDKNLRDKNMSEAVQNPDTLIGYALGINMTNLDYKENTDKTFKTLEKRQKII